MQITLGIYIFFLTCPESVNKKVRLHIAFKLLRDSISLKILSFSNRHHSPLYVLHTLVVIGRAIQFL